MFKKLQREQVFMGYTFEFKSIFFFFGSRHVSFEDLPQLFPHYDFSFLKQVHGRAVVRAESGTRPESDGHFSTAPGQALVVQSADCVPILLANSQEICALHAGWRGVAQNIVAAAHATRPGFQPEVVALGPHIGTSSFQIGADVRDQLVQSCSEGATLSRPDGQGKFLSDLDGAVRAQVRDNFGPEPRLVSCSDDTVTHAEFHSYRRERERAGRNFSFVVINPAKPV